MSELSKWQSKYNQIGYLETFRKDKVFYLVLYTNYERYQK